MNEQKGSWLFELDGKSYKIGERFYLTEQAHLKKISNQDLINVKLGVKNVLPDVSTDPERFLYKVVRTEDNVLYYYYKDCIKIK